MSLRNTFKQLVLLIVTGFNFYANDILKLTSILTFQSQKRINIMNLILNWKDKFCSNCNE